MDISTLTSLSLYDSVITSNGTDVLVFGGRQNCVATASLIRLHFVSNSQPATCNDEVVTCNQHKSCGTCLAGDHMQCIWLDRQLGDLFFQLTKLMSGRLVVVFNFAKTFTHSSISWFPVLQSRAERNPERGMIILWPTKNFRLLFLRFTLIYYILIERHCE